MKEYFKNILKQKTTRYIGTVLPLLWLCSNMALTGCKKERLFTHVDSTAAVPSQFHFFNTFSYDNSLLFSVDGLAREIVNEFTFSKYYPSSSAFNLNSQQPNSKLINVSDPAIQTQYANLPSNNTFQFKPNTSYIVFTTNPAYDTVSSPIKTAVPYVSYYPEDIYHPFNGTTGIRVFDCVSHGNGSQSLTLSVTPNVGQGTTNLLSPIYTVIQPLRASDSYTTTQAGLKKITLLLQGSTAVQFSYLPVQLGDGNNYSFFAVGDVKNFLAGIQPRPRLFVVEDGNPSSSKELTLSSISYPGNLSTTSQVTVINDAYNVPGILNFGDFNAGSLVQYFGLNVQFNQTTLNVSRWPIVAPPSGPITEDVGDANSMLTGAYPLNILHRITTDPYLTPGAYQVSVVPGGAFSPLYTSFDYNFQQGIAYTVCLLPNNTTSQKCGELVLENDDSPNNSFFKLRIINIMGGTTQLDVHNGSPSGPIIASALSYGQVNDYISLKPSLITQNLYITAAGSVTPLFQIGTNAGPIAMPFTPGNSGTLYLMGLLPGTPYSGDKGSFGPYVYYNSDAYINQNSAFPNSQLYF